MAADYVVVYVVRRNRSTVYGSRTPVPFTVVAQYHLQCGEKKYTYRMAAGYDVVFYVVIA